MKTKKGDTSIEILKEPFSIDCKRLYLPVLVKSKCPECGEPIEYDLRENYLMYPELGEVEQVGGLCPNDHEFTIHLKLTINVEEA